MRKLVPILSLALLFSSCSSFFIDDGEFQSRINKIKEQNDELKRNIEEKKENFEYFSSEEYKDKYAKMYLEKINAGERVIVLTYDEGQEDQIEYELDDFFEENNQSFADVQKKVFSALDEMGIVHIDDRYKPEIREYHVFTRDNVWIWLNLMTSIDLQLHKFKIAQSDEEFEVNEYIDLRIPAKVIYK